MNSIFPHEKIEGFQDLSLDYIDQVALNVLNRFNPLILERNNIVPFEELILYLEKEEKIKFKFDQDLKRDSSLNQILGIYDAESNTIYLDKSVYKGRRDFILAHEIGHYFLHRQKLMINKQIFNDYKASEHTLMLGKTKPLSRKSLIEWQATSFANSLLMPEKSIMRQLYDFQKNRLSIAYGKVHLPHNKVDFQKIILNLGAFFNLSKDIIAYRLKDLNAVVLPQELDLENMF